MYSTYDRKYGDSLITVTNEKLRKGNPKINSIK
jgi:hypothetical protein